MRGYNRLRTRRLRETSYPDSERFFPPGFLARLCTHLDSGTPPVVLLRFDLLFPIAGSVFVGYKLHIIDLS
jgi:hypothetical protein